MVEKYIDVIAMIIGIVEAMINDVICEDKSGIIEVFTLYELLILSIQQSIKYLSNNNFEISFALIWKNKNKFEI